MVKQQEWFKIMSVHPKTNKEWNPFIFQSTSERWQHDLLYEYSDELYSRLNGANVGVNVYYSLGENDFDEDPVCYYFIDVDGELCYG